ncbi:MULTISPECIES: helix-turn-helix domain-containing protein [unclassified Shinella]|uniref:helix-turn-helix domain-containing protein n=1 Tax=unclassified Shinella TaxID=2643062 RepID=UPI0009E91B29|nr:MULTISPECIES: helix-turn-helix domain-containing protein [unclassified Shinella]
MDSPSEVVGRRYAGKSKKVTLPHEELEKLSIMTTAEAAAYLRLSYGRLAVLRSIGGGPVFIAQSSRKCLYRKADLDRWLDDRARVNNASVG